MTDIEHQDMTSEAAVLSEKLLDLNPEEERYRIIKATLDYKASWLSLAEHLNTIADNKSYKEWGYTSFKDYCTEEIQIPQSTVQKLVRGFKWVDSEAPDVLKQFIMALQNEADEELPTCPVPELDMVNVLVAAQKELGKQRLSEDVYANLKQQALSGEKSARELKKDMRDALPEELLAPKVQELKVLRKALSTTEKVIAQLEELQDADPEVMALLNQLRDKVFDLVSSLLDEQAYTPVESND